MDHTSGFEALGKIGICIQARLSSSRLPGKIFFTLGSSGYNSLSLIFRRLERVIENYPYLRNVYVLTTQDPCDDAIESFCTKEAKIVFRGARDDVLSRYYDAANIHNLDTIVRVTSDCPFIDPLEIHRVLVNHLANSSDYTTNSFAGSSVMDGGDVEVFTFSALHKAFINSTLYSEREHVTPYMSTLNSFKCLYSDPLLPHPYSRLTLDTPLDYNVISSIVHILHSSNKIDASMYDICELYHRQNLSLINGFIARNSGWASSFLKDKE